MARGVLLSEMLDMLRAEAMISTNPNLSTNILPNLKQILQRTQRQLWLEHEWKFLSASSDKIVAAGQRYYDFPTDIDSSRIQSVWYRWNNLFIEVEKGIAASDYNAFDSELTTPVRSDPVMRWDFTDTDERQFEIHPIPATSGTSAGGYVRFYGTRNLNTFVADTDRCTLDADLIVLFAAAEVLGPRNEKEADRKLKMANALLTRLKGTYATAGGKIGVLGGGGEPQRRFPRQGPPWVAVDRG
jgi:hypothetical protein